MPLYEILANKPCIWILKELYEAEVVNRKIYTIRASDLKKTFKIDNPERFITILEDNGLLHVDDIDGDKVIALNQKGKDFFKMFDRLKILTESQVKIVEDNPVATVEYNLNDKEKKLLISAFKTIKNVDNDLNLNTFIPENKKNEFVYDKLQKLNLIAKVKNPKGKGMLITLTPTGKKAIQDDVGKGLK